MIGLVMLLAAFTSPMPVSVDFGEYDPARAALMDAVGDRLMDSVVVTPNVDAYRALVVKVRLIARDKRRLAVVTYSYNAKLLGRSVFQCSRAQIAPCSIAIVNGAERASLLVRRTKTKGA